MACGVNLDGRLDDEQSANLAVSAGVTNVTGYVCIFWTRALSSGRGRKKPREHRTAAAVARSYRSGQLRA
jgi:hypothetical protein